MLEVIVMGFHSFEDLKRHVGHEIVLVVYRKKSNPGDIENVALECQDCNEVLLEFDKE
jgi:hypothetical protein